MGELAKWVHLENKQLGNGVGIDGYGLHAIVCDVKTRTIYTILPRI